jgi:enamine deaminase RidA (YjgF/YER057c/UK114 family)
MHERQRVPATTPWSAMVGYSRAVRVGGHVYVAGTGSLNDDGTVEHPRDAYAQARRACEVILDALKQVGAGAEHVVRTRIYLRRPEDWIEVGSAHDEFFGEARPVTTMVTVTGFLHPAIMVEIEAEAEL